MSGTLFVVATPIGNLEDMTFRAVRILKEVDLIAAEDTRRTSKLLAHYDIRRPVTSLREHNESTESARLVARLLAGESVALVSDAGTPGIADPGARLVRTARDAGVRVIPIPGASAVAAALSASGFASSEFTFLGFPPPSGAARERWLIHLSRTPGTVVFFEAPHRISRTLTAVRGYAPGRPLVVFRELTKINESSVECPPGAEACEVPELGEFTVVLGPVAGKAHDLSLADDTIASLFGALAQLDLVEGSELERLVGVFLDIPETAVRKAVKRARFAAARRLESDS